MAKTARALMATHRAFQERRVRKTYRALAVGRLDGEGTVSEPVDGRAAITRWRAVDHCRSLKAGWLTTVELSPVTGRTHQLRRHLAALGTPILGDVAYGIDGLVYRGKGLFLWAVALRLDHPITGQPLALRVEEPPKFASMRAREERRWRRHHG